MAQTAIVAFAIPGRLKGWARPRFDSRSKIVFKDKETASHQLMVREAAARAMGHRPLLEGPVALWVKTTTHRPQSWSNRRKASTLHVITRPDVDNLAKLIMDALNNVVYFDDKQVCELHYKRTYN